MTKHPYGVWIWELAKIDPNYLQRLKRQNCQRIYLKVFDGESRSMFWAHQCSKALISKFHSEGIEVYGWGYHYGTPNVDAQVTAVRKALDCGLDGYIFDLEQEIKDPNTHDDVKKLIQAIRPHVESGTLGYTSFGHPGLHSEIPWKLLDDLCDLAFPQIYFEKWGFNNNDEAEVKEAIEAHKKKGLKKPILPIWGSEEDATRPATVATLQKFINQYPGSSIFRVPNIGQKGEAWNLNYAGESLVVGEEPLPIAAKPTQALFRMQLEESTGLVVGNLFLFDANGKQIFDAVATSGQPGSQSPDDLWKPGQGPIPNLSGLEVSTEGLHIESRDIKGLFFPITPYTFASPNGGVTRGGFGIYNDAGAPGTSGGIGIVNPNSYDRFCAIMDSALRAGLTKIALKVEYGGRSRAAVRPAKAIFKMKLANTSGLIWGHLFLLDTAGNQIFDAVATSGLPGTQGADDLWKPGVGPIPALSGIKIDTQGIYMPTKQGVNGWFFPAVPYWFKNPRTGRNERGDFGVHFDANVPGSAGCIVIENANTFARFRDIMVAARRAGVNQIPLQVDYSGTRSITTRGLDSAKGISIHVGLNLVDPDHYQGWDGQLNGCENDAIAMQAIANQKGFKSQLILTEKATANQLKQALTKAAGQLESGDILLLTYSGHGGQIPDINGDEEDNLDETWVLYDRELLDDELYTLYGQFKPGVRIFVLSDSCHSGTVTKERLYKNLVSGETVVNGNYHLRTPEQAKIRVIPKDVQNQTYYMNQGLYRKLQNENSEFDRNNIAASVILISGCQDNQLSLDGVTNGFFTQTLLEVWKSGDYQGDYRDFRRDIGLLMPPWQSPHYYTVGTPSPEFESQLPFTISLDNNDSNEGSSLGNFLNFDESNFEGFSFVNHQDFDPFSENIQDYEHAQV